MRGTQETTNLPKASLDVAFMSDVYHHLERPERVLASLREAIKPGGKLVVVEFDRVEGKKHGIRLETRAGRPRRLHQGDRVGGFQTNDRSPKAPVLKENFFVTFERIGSADESKSPAARVHTNSCARATVVCAKILPVANSAAGTVRTPARNDPYRAINCRSDQFRSAPRRARGSAG